MQSYGARQWKMCSEIFIRKNATSFEKCNLQFFSFWYEYACMYTMHVAIVVLIFCFSSFSSLLSSPLLSFNSSVLSRPQKRLRCPKLLVNALVRSYPRNYEVLCFLRTVCFKVSCMNPYIPAAQHFLFVLVISRLKCFMSRSSSWIWSCPIYCQKSCNFAGVPLKYSLCFVNFFFYCSHWCTLVSAMIMRACYSSDYNWNYDFWLSRFG